MSGDWAYSYRAKVVDVHDGDTIVMDIDLGFGIRLPGMSWSGKRELACRVLGINAPELHTSAGDEARDYAQTLLPLGTIVSVISHKWDKFGGRFDGSITLPDGRDFAKTMLDTGHAVPFMTGANKP